MFLKGGQSFSKKKRLVNLIYITIKKIKIFLSTKIKLKTNLNTKNISIRFVKEQGLSDTGKSSKTFFFM